MRNIHLSSPLRNSPSEVAKGKDFINFWTLVESSCVKEKMEKPALTCGQAEVGGSMAGRKPQGLV